MDRYGPLPLTLTDLALRLQRGETFMVRGADGFDVALFLDGEQRVILRQGSQDHPFRQLEVAVLTLLNGLGEFSLGSEEA